MGQVMALFPDEPEKAEEIERFRQQRKLTEFFKVHYAKTHASNLNPNPNYNFTKGDVMALKRLMKNDHPFAEIVVFIKEFLDFDRDNGAYAKIPWAKSRTLSTMCSNAVVAELQADPDVMYADLDVIRREFPHVFK